MGCESKAGLSPASLNNRANGKRSQQPHSPTTGRDMSLSEFAAEHPFLTVIYALVAIYGIETFIKAARGGMKKHRRK